MQIRAVGTIASLAAWSALAGSCGGPGQVPEPTYNDVQDIRNAVLVQPTAFDLGLPEDFFIRDGRALPDAPNTRSCHTQGATIAGRYLFLSCVLLSPRNLGDPDARSATGKSFILRAPLCQITGCEGQPPAAQVAWAARELTELVPESESHRITRQLRNKDKLSAEDRAVRRLLNHPSGLEYDSKQGGVWVANAAYAPNTYSHMYLIDPEKLSNEGPVRNFASVKSHIGAVMRIDERYLLGWSWASRNLVISDLSGSGRSSMTPHPALDTDDHVDIQDCTHWQGTQVLCGGYFKYEVRPEAPDERLSADQLSDPARDTIRVGEGRVQIFDIDVSQFPQVTAKLVGTIRGKLNRKAEASVNLGVGKYRIDAQGRPQPLAENNYGGYKSVKPVSYEAMTLGPDRRYIYFLPDDLPAGKLIRMRLTE